MEQTIQKPLPRSDLRLKLGKIYHTFKRRIYWIFGPETYAKTSETILEHICFSHQTPLMRKLRGVDMYLQKNKVENLKLAAPKIDKITLRPGETFSYWKTIGNPSKRKGYLKGMVLRNGGFYAGTGGGLCQLSNLIYWMTIHTPLTVTERHRHSYDVFPDSNRTQPFGSGATCFYNYGDLMIKNDTEHSFQLRVEVGDAHLKGMWASDSPMEYAYEVYEKDHIITREYWGGYGRHNSIYRRKLDKRGNVMSDEFVVENHAIMMYQPFLQESSSATD